MRTPGVLSKQKLARLPTRRLRSAVAGLTHSIAELIWLTAEDRTLTKGEIDTLRARRQQLSAVIDRLQGSTSRGP